MKYRATQTCRLGAGTVMQLTPEQAAARRHALEPLEGGKRHRALEPVQFKAGEVLGLDGDLPKALAALLEPLDKPAKRPSEKAEQVAIV